MTLRRSLAFAAGISCLAPASAWATTYEVGPGKPYATLQDTLPLITAGDVVEVQGDQTYPGDLWFRSEQAGTPDKPVTIRGIKVNGHRPILAGVGTEQYHNIIVLFYGNNIVFEGFEIVGDGNPDNVGIVNKANNTVIRDVVVHGVGNQGLLGTDSESGSLTLESSEFYNNGNGLYSHQIYMATDETMYPGSVFRMQYCYVHDGAGGNNVKSRSERNEIYYNWIEGAFYHELDLIGPDGQDENLAREDSDVVGNVLVKHSEWRIARIGGDGTGNTSGRYRFVNNTMVLGPTSEVAIGLQFTVESLEMHNNVIFRTGGSGGRIWNHADPLGPEAVFFGSNNWIQDGLTEIPPEFTGTIGGTDPGFTDAATFDFRPVEGSLLVDAGSSSTSIATPAFVDPLPLPLQVPPARALGTEGDRAQDATPDIGAFELGTGTGPGPGTGGAAGASGASGSAGQSGSAGSNAGSSGAAQATPDEDSGGCGCRVANDTRAPSTHRAASFGLLVLALGLRRPRRRV